MDVLRTVLAIITNPIIVGIISTVAGLAIKKWVGYKKFYKEINDVVKSYLDATSRKSPNGKHITKAEYQAIGKEVIEAIQAGAPLFRKKKTP